MVPSRWAICGQASSTPPSIRSAGTRSYRPAMNVRTAATHSLSSSAPNATRSLTGRLSRGADVGFAESSPDRDGDRIGRRRCRLVTTPPSELDTRTRLDIADVLVRYATGIDRRDWTLFRSCFTDDCVADYGDIGVWHGADRSSRAPSTDGRSGAAGSRRCSCRPSGDDVSVRSGSGPKRTAGTRQGPWHGRWSAVRVFVHGQVARKGGSGRRPGLGDRSEGLETHGRHDLGEESDRHLPRPTLIVCGHRFADVAERPEQCVALDGQLVHGQRHPRRRGGRRRGGRMSPVDRVPVPVGSPHRRSTGRGRRGTAACPAIDRRWPRATARGRIGHDTNSTQRCRSRLGSFVRPLPLRTARNRRSASRR